LEGVGEAAEAVATTVDQAASGCEIVGGEGRPDADLVR